MCPSEVAGVQAADLGAGGRDVDRHARCTSTVRPPRPRGRRRPRSWRAETLTTDAEGRVRSRWRIYNVTALKTTRKIAANTAIRPMIPKATGFDALRDSTLRTPCSSCASKYLA